MRFSLTSALLVAGVLALAISGHAQESHPAVEQSRLFPRTIPPTSPSITADGMTLPGGGTVNSEDESFGAQQILKTQEKATDFTIGGSASVFYTSNVALTRYNTISDGFFVGDAGFSWAPRVNPELQLEFNARASIFRYFDTTVLDFESLGAGVGVIWTPANAWEIAVIGRYDFTELLDSHSNELLQDHQFSLALQKVVPLGRSHALSFSIIGSAGISDPFVQQRDQVGFAIGYHLRLARQLDSDFGYRLSGYFYNGGGRNDLNQVLSAGLHYHVTPWATIDGFMSGAFNNSNRGVFEYDVFSSGGGVGLTIRF